MLSIQIFLSFIFFIKSQVRSQHNVNSNITSKLFCYMIIGLFVIGISSPLGFLGVSFLDPEENMTGSFLPRINPRRESNLVIKVFV